MQLRLGRHVDPTSPANDMPPLELMTVYHRSTSGFITDTLIRILLDEMSGSAFFIFGLVDPYIPDPTHFVPQDHEVN